MLPTEKLISFCMFFIQKNRNLSTQRGLKNRRLSQQSAFFLTKFLLSKCLNLAKKCRQIALQNDAFYRFLFHFSPTLLRFRKRQIP